MQKGRGMLAGMVVSAVLGGIAGLCFALTRDHGLAQAILAYQLGGMIAVLTFLAGAQPGMFRIRGWR